ncbi:hypothetical protein B0J12DRAFT_427057 [Macrophomina phaseolina]|uniref:Secreted protein n=1 Tax=Macrophomina phaseolina TaxID=35725 RepID=A0ABQ8GGT7_9PEZI|nr:hypothetical protein B0J12DRAFT_427057 [Macrophomina phaseolina]
MRWLACWVLCWVRDVFVYCGSPQRWRGRGKSTAQSSDDDRAHGIPRNWSPWRVHDSFETSRRHGKRGEASIYSSSFDLTIPVVLARKWPMCFLEERPVAELKLQR